jgi:AraC-like DNA-binding protein
MHILRDKFNVSQLKYAKVRMEIGYLNNHQVLSSKNLHEISEKLSVLANTTGLDVVGTGNEIDAVINAVSFSTINLAHVYYGHIPTLLKEAECDQDCLLFILPTAGHGTVKHRGLEFDISPDVGLMRDFKAPLVAKQESFATFGLPLPLSLLKQYARTLIGEEADWLDFHFDSKIDLSTSGGRHVRDTIQYVAHALNGPMRNLDNALVLDGFRDLLLSNILTLLPNSHSTMLQRQPVSGALPYHVKRARDYIHGNVHLSITLEDLARHAGCGYRTLQIAFNDIYGMSPMAYVKSVRLSRAHKDILCAQEGVTVMDIAGKWGFTHMGRFANMYKHQYGVSPSHTLRTRS